MIAYLAITVISPVFLGSLLLRIWTMTSWYQMEAAERRLLDVRFMFAFCACVRLANLNLVLVLVLVLTQQYLVLAFSLFDELQLHCQKPIIQRTVARLGTLAVLGDGDELVEESSQAPS